MSLITSLYTGSSGLDASSAELAVVSDNISNANTIGFKEGRADFEDALAQNLIGGTPSTDLAIDGSGFFVVKGNNSGVDGSFYTRAGQFTIDKDGFLVNQAGLQVQGYTADATGKITPTGVGALDVGKASSAPLATTAVTVRANLQADATVPAAVFDPLNAGTTSNFSTSVSVYDSLGAPHQVDIYFAKTAAGAWDYHALTDGGGLAGGVAGTPTEVATGALTFDTQGRLATQAGTSTFNPAGSIDPQALTFNFGDPTAAAGTGLLGITQFTAPSAASFVNQDGYASGQLSGLSVDSKGDVTGAFTNGQSRIMGQVAIANFKAPDQLTRLGGNLFAEMPASGPPTVGAPGTADRGSIVAGALEQSNVDLAAEFVRMIAAQRQFEANSKTLQTADSLLQELINIKR